MDTAPIAFFAYKRPDHMLRSLTSLAQNVGAEASELFIFCDAAKHLKDEIAVSQVRAIAKEKKWCGKVHVIERKTNLGCAQSVINGVTEICQTYGKVIVVEDDLILSPFFLDYMNRALKKYEEHERVMQISGHMFPVNLNAEADAIFLPFTTSWGWATWQRGWKHFDPEMAGYDLLKGNKKLRCRFNLNNSYPYFEMLTAQQQGSIDSWAIRWYLSVFLLEGLTLYPLRSLVENIGFDGSGTHCGNNSTHAEFLTEKNILLLPEYIDQDNLNSKVIFEYLKSPARGVTRQFIRKIVSLIH